MKKLAITLIACLAFVQAQAATSALTESLLEYEAITFALGTDPSFENIIPQNEFIVDIRRITKGVNVVGTVRYEIFTRVITANEQTDLDQDMLETNSHRCKKRRRHRPSEIHAYIATLDVAPNPGIGPNIVTVVSITPVAD